MKQSLLCCLAIVILHGCVPTRQNPKYLFSSGVYTVRSAGEKKKAFLDIEEDSIRVFSPDNAGRYDTTRYAVISLEDTVAVQRKQYSFSKYSLDLDFISIPLKFRPSLSGFPAQLNATANGGLFIGRRKDVYRLYRKRNVLGIQSSSLEHYGFSIGAFAGVGAAVMNPSVTRNRIDTEYDAVVIPFGLTALLGYNNFTFGLAGGFDHMLNSHRKYWIYRGQPWIGLAVGLNLN